MLIYLFIESHSSYKKEEWFPGLWTVLTYFFIASVFIKSDVMSILKKKKVCVGSDEEFDLVLQPLLVLEY